MKYDHHLYEYIKLKQMSPSAFAESLGLARPDRLYNVLNGKNGLSEKFAKLIVDTYNDVSYDWLLTGEGEMISMEGKSLQSVKEPAIEYNTLHSNLVPFYDDVATTGGNNIAYLDPQTRPTEYIETGTWFGSTRITAAIRHYGDSMIEYPNGCILALKEIADFDNVVWGRNYVIETSEIRVTKRIQSGKSESSVTAYSSNQEVYPDGRQIHEPFQIKRDKIRRVFLVVGRIVKENGSGSFIPI